MKKIFMQRNYLRKAFSDIKSLKIQGASKIRNKIVSTIKKTAVGSKAKTVGEFRQEIKGAMSLLLSARPTEPDSRTAVRILLKALNEETKDVSEAKKIMIRACNNYKKDRKASLQKISRIGTAKIKKGSVVFTHCHSHTVEAILLKARKRIKKVICTETRPLYQGRITAAALARGGINVELVVDSAAAEFMQQADLFITGCDAILADGGIVNKIGTKQISLIAKEAGVPYYVASSSHSFDPATLFGKKLEIEERSAGEVWGKRMKNLYIRNPAFDITKAAYVKGIISEKGVLSPKTFVKRMKKELKLKGKSLRQFSLAYLLK